MTTDESRKIIKLLKAVYGNRAGVDEESWVFMLDQYEFDDVKNAIKAYRNRKPFIPTINEIISEIDNAFKMLREDIGGDGVIYYMWYKNETLVFNCMSRTESQAVLDWVKTYPTYDEALKKWNQFLIGREKGAELYEKRQGYF